jgi:CorA-like Mg2+ transporter protein
MTNHAIPSENLVRHFRQIILWPLQLVPQEGGRQADRPWEILRQTAGHAWRPAEELFAGDLTRFQDRHYGEFITFMPYVQRFLYGEGARDAAEHRESPVHILRRDDVARVRVTLDLHEPPITLEVYHVDLYFLVDIDVVILVLELFAEDLTFPQAQDLMFRVGRAYPGFWRPDGQGGRCPAAVEWITRSGEVLARSDYENRTRYLSTVARTRASCIASHWEWLLQPLVSDASDQPAPLRYQQLEYYRMPLLGYLAFDDPTKLSRDDFVSLGLVSGPAERGTLPFSARSLDHFEEEYCYDRYWAPHESHSWTNTRLICTGHSFFMVGSSKDRLFTDPAGLLGQFRRQYFLLGLIAHFHKAALLMLSDRLVFALTRLDARDVDSIKRFKRRIRRLLETFLRFSHRYWFHEVSTQDQARDLFQMWRRHLDTERLYAEVREEIQDMSDYLNGDSLRRQANTVVRLTVVTTLGLIWTVATGVLGMNLFAQAETPWATKLVYFLLVLIPSAFFIFYTVVRSKGLADFLEALSEERVGWRAKLGVLGKALARRPTGGEAA